MAAASGCAASISFSSIIKLIDVALCGGGIFSYFKFKKKYWELMEKKLEKLEE